ncbi:type IV secretion system DNA-binding domain-containing protein [Rothia uropygialis]|uniref:type IV secretion system DNA-binding domain-containing protein n=1 Tax=Kocuria sp. 36 TaxID=1415402 RepID=UPI0013EB779E|nr:type IV secretion system DNA-binding domain-containing protein [Kocuria sp. 36]
MVLLAYPATYGLTRLRRVRMRYVILGSAVALFLLLVAGAVKAYTAVYVDLLHTMTSLDGIGTIKADLAHLIGTHWRGWLLGQLPVAVVGAVLIGSVIAWRRERYRADWREQTKPKPVKPKKVKKATEKLSPIIERQKPKSMDEVRIQLGVDENTMKPLPITIGDLRRHIFVPGPSGSGKSTTLRQLLRGVTEGEVVKPYRIGTIYINLKPDPALTKYLQELAQRTGRRFHRITQNGHGATTTYNPMKHGTVEEKRDLLVYAESNAQEGGFSEPHYYATSMRFTLVALKALEVLVNNGATYSAGGQARPWKMDIAHLVRAMRMPVLEEVAHSGGDAELSEQLMNYFAEIKEDKDTASGVGGIRTRFANIAEGAARAVLSEEDGGLDLAEAVRGGDIVLFDLDAAVDLIDSQYIANLAISDYKSCMARLSAQNWHGATDEEDPKRMNLLTVDEFGALGGTGLTSLLERGRAWGACVVLTLQAYTAMAAKFGDDFRADVMTNTSLKIIHQQDDGADELAGYIGTDTVWKETLQTYEDRDFLGSQSEASGQGTLRETEQFSFHPNEIKRLDAGEAIVLIKMPRRAAKVKIYRSKSTPTPAPKQIEAPAREHENETGTVVPTLDEATQEAPQEPRRPQERPQKPKVDVWAAAAAQTSTRKPDEPQWGDDAADDDMPPMYD